MKFPPTFKLVLQASSFIAPYKANNVAAKVFPKDNIIKILVTQSDGVTALRNKGFTKSTKSEKSR